MAEYIEREALVSILNAKADMAIGTQKQVFLSVAKMVELLPAADVVEVKCGHNTKDTPSLFECSACGWCCWDTYTGDTDEYKFCPNCGAKMDQ